MPLVRPQRPGSKPRAGMQTQSRPCYPQIKSGSHRRSCTRPLPTSAPSSGRCHPHASARQYQAGAPLNGKKGGGYSRCFSSLRQLSEQHGGYNKGQCRYPAPPKRRQPRKSAPHVRPSCNAPIRFRSDASRWGFALLSYRPLLYQSWRGRLGCSH